MILSCKRWKKKIRRKTTLVNQFIYVLIVLMTILFFFPEGDVGTLYLCLTEELGEIYMSCDIIILQSIVVFCFQM